ncbi:MAG: CrcB family protein [Vicinamibacterales bacterium]
MLYTLVGAGGCFGSITRFAMARYIGGLVATRFPLGTLVINITASFLLGVVGSVVAARVSPASEALRLAIGVGFIGGYSTFSTLEYRRMGSSKRANCSWRSATRSAVWSRA